MTHEPNPCLYFRYLESMAHRLQANYAKDGRAVHQERARELWRLIVNCIGPLASEARGATYGSAYRRLGEEMCDLANYGRTQPGIIARIGPEERMPLVLPDGLLPFAS